ncbi:glycosyltransferase family 4 protein [Rothia uropygialis]|uniref:glycosyltransferase family 4 protein n=1 Tax=Kocuria sp. 36 TaxID=1415402 RepID=UPI0013EDBE97|nr:glycosyltransferase family 4 protein [Kocuria sp. 36]
MALADSRPRALWLVPVPDIGGVARHVLDVARAGLPGWELHVLCPAGELARRLRAQGAHVETGEFGTEFGLLRSARTLERAIRRLRPDVVHSHLAFADVVSAVVVGLRQAMGRLPGASGAPLLVTTEHGIAPEDSLYQSSPVRAKAMNIVHSSRLRITDRTIAVCESTKCVMETKWHARDVRVVHNGVDVDAVEKAVRRHREKHESSEGTRFLSLSRLAPEKHIDTVIRAFAAVHEVDPEVTLVVGGEGPLKADLEALASELELGEAVTFPGFVEPYQALAQADVLVQISEWENYSYTLLDAVAAGVPVVTNDVGGNQEIVGGDTLASPVSTDDLAERMRGYYPVSGSTPGSVARSLPNLNAMTDSITKLYSRSDSMRGTIALFAAVGMNAALLPYTATTRGSRRAKELLLCPRSRIDRRFGVGEVGPQ